MEKKRLSMILRLPAEILLICSFLASAYVRFSGNMQVSFGAVALLLLINISYFVGRFLSKKSSFDF